MDKKEKPIRIQRKRTKGWKMPENTIYVGRPSKWANPFKIGRDGDREECVQKHRELTIAHRYLINFSDLKGKNLACWCRLDEPCHADFLLELANLN